MIGFAGGMSNEAVALAFRCANARPFCRTRRGVVVDTDKRGAQVEPVEIAETGRRRRWLEDEKLELADAAPGRHPHRGEARATSV